jgi:hypothetical protein
MARNVLRCRCSKSDVLKKAIKKGSNHAIASFRKSWRFALGAGGDAAGLAVAFRYPRLPFWRLSWPLITKWRPQQIKEQIMNESIIGVSEPSVGTRINWGAIVAGSVLAFGFYLLFASLGTAVGLSISEHMGPSALHGVAIAWAFVSTAGAFFVGGLVASLLTTGENRVEATLHGAMVWALMLAFLVSLGVAGARSGFTAMIALANAAPSHGWETAARNAGVSPEQIDNLRRTMGTAAQNAHEPERQQELTDAAKRLGWYSFAGIWGSMIAAAVGALVGAGRTFRETAVTSTHSLISTRTS